MFYPKYVVFSINTKTEYSLFMTALAFTDVVKYVTGGDCLFGVLQEDSDDKHAFVRGLAGLGKILLNSMSLLRCD